MSSHEKLYERLKNNPFGCSFSELKSVLEHEGFELVRTSGSHFVFSKDKTTFVIPSHNRQVKSVYVKRALALIEEARKAGKG